MKKYIANCITFLGILIGIAACIKVFTDPSWLWAEVLLAGALVMDALDGRAARAFGGTKMGPYLDDVADAINFGIHPALWIWITTHNATLSILYVCAIIYRLTRFTIKKQSHSDHFTGLPSPAAAVIVLGWIALGEKELFDAIAFVFISFLAISHIPCIHVMKFAPIRKILPLAILLAVFLPEWYGGGTFGIGLTQVVLIASYILVSIIFLMPAYAFR